MRRSAYSNAPLLSVGLEMPERCFGISVTAGLMPLSNIGFVSVHGSILAVKAEPEF